MIVIVIVILISFPNSFPSPQFLIPNLRPWALSSPSNSVLSESSVVILLPLSISASQNLRNSPLFLIPNWRAPARLPPLSASFK